MLRSSRQFLKFIPRHLKLIESEKRCYYLATTEGDLVKAENVRQTIFRVYNNPDAFYKVKRSTKCVEEDNKVAEFLNDVNRVFCDEIQIFDSNIRLKCLDH